MPGAVMGVSLILAQTPFQTLSKETWEFIIEN